MSRTEEKLRTIKFVFGKIRLEVDQLEMILAQKGQLDENREDILAVRQKVEGAISKVIDMLHRSFHSGAKLND